MSYTNPQTFVSQEYAKQNQQLQATIAGTAANLSAQYVQRQKELRDKEEQKVKENKATKTNIANKSLKLLNTVGTIDNANPSVDFGTLYEPMVEEYKNLSESVAFGTSEDPIADQKRIDEIFGSVNKITGTMQNLVDFTTDFGPGLDIMGEPGGIFEGSDPALIKGLSIMTEKLGGKRVPKYKKEGDLNSFVWEIYDEDDNLVYEFSQLRLDQLSKGIDEMVTTVPNQTKANNAVELANKDIFETKESNDGTIASTGGIKEAFLLNPTRTGTTSTTIGADGRATGEGYNTIRKVNKYDKNGIYTNSNWNASMDEVIAEVLADGDTSRSAIALSNSQFKKVVFTEEDFRSQFNGRYAEGPLPQLFQDAIADDDDTPGYTFDFEKNLTKEEEEIFSIAYKKDYLDNKVKNEVAGQKVNRDLQENKGDEAIRNENEMKTYLDGKVQELLKGKKDGVVNNADYVKIIKDDMSLDAEVRDNIKAITPAFIKSSSKRYKDAWYQANKLNPEDTLDADQQNALDSYVAKGVDKVKAAGKKGLIWDSKYQVGIGIDELNRKISQRQKDGKRGDTKYTGSNDPEPIVYE